MPICKGMTKMYLMFYEKTTTVFERRKHMKKILSFVLAFAMITAVTSTAFAATWDSSSLTGSFYTTGSITKSSSSTWGATTTISVSRLKSTGATKIKVTPVNANQQVSGGTLYFSSTGTKYSSMTNTNWNTIKLYIQNNNGGTNIESSGSWTNSAS